MEPVDAGDGGKLVARGRVSGKGGKFFTYSHKAFQRIKKNFKDLF
jgi:hypothetical protein